MPLARAHAIATYLSLRKTGAMPYNTYIFPISSQLWYKQLKRGISVFMN